MEWQGNSLPRPHPHPKAFIVLHCGVNDDARIGLSILQASDHFPNAIADELDLNLRILLGHGLNAVLDTTVNTHASLNSDGKLSLFPTADSGRALHQKLILLYQFLQAPAVFLRSGRWPQAVLLAADK